MAGFSTYLQQKLLDHILGVAAYTAPTPYIGLYTAAPTDAGGGTEVSGNAYARVNISAAFSAASGTAITNDVAVTFPQASGSWGTVTHFGIFDAATSGNLLLWGTLTPSKTVGSGDTLSIGVGDLDVTLD